MRIIGHETWVVRIPFETNRAATHIVLQLNTDEGARGISYGTAYGTGPVPWTVKPICAALDALMERVVSQDPMAVESINAKLLAWTARPQFDGLARSAASIIDIALWDLKAKALSLPLYRLLGGSSNEVPVYAGWNLFPRSASPDLEILAANATEHAANGFRAMKVHVPRVQSMTDVVACARVMREAVGDDIDLCMDMNWSRSVKDAIAIGREVAEFRLSWIEDPIPANDHDGPRQITEALETPVCAGETFHQAVEFRSVLDRRAVDVIMVDLEVGGITQFLRIAHIVEAYGIPLTYHVTMEAAAHALAAVNGRIAPGAYLPWAAPLFTEKLPIRSGRLALFERPGLGLDLDPAALKTFAV